MTKCITIGDRVYLANAIAGEPGVVVRITGLTGYVTWPDMPEITEPTKHKLDTLVVDEGFIARSNLDFETAAA
jgi:hypothetical protein